VADLTDNISYYGLGEQLLGKRMGVYCEATLVIACYRKYVSYLITIGMLPGEIIQSLGLDWGVAEEPRLWIALFCLIILPLCLVNKISSLKYLPYLSVAASIVVASVIVAESFLEISDIESDALNEFTEKPYDSLSEDVYPYTYPINRILLAFCCQCNVLYIYSYITFRDIPKGMTVISLGMLSVNFVYLLVSSFGYFLLYEVSDDDFNIFKIMRQNSSLAILVAIT
jgi:amino acid permease